MSTEGMEVRKINFLIRVIGDTGNKTESVIMSNNKAGIEQENIFRTAGYKNVRMEIIYATRNEDGEVFLVDFRGPVVVSDAAIPTQVTRQEMNPGIDVYDYDRNVLKRRATVSQILCAVAVSAMLFVGLAGLSGGVMIMLFDRLRSVSGLIAVAVFFIAWFIGMPKYVDTCIKLGKRFAGIEE